MYYLYVDCNSLYFDITEIQKKQFGRNYIPMLIITSRKKG